VIHPGENTNAIRRTEQRTIPELRMIDVISFLKKNNVIPDSLFCPASARRQAGIHFGIFLKKRLDISYFIGELMFAFCWHGAE
jgi:hypothetical protein